MSGLSSAGACGRSLSPTGLRWHLQVDGCLLRSPAPCRQRPPRASPVLAAEIAKLFIDMDAAAPKPPKGDVPLKLVGRSGELVESLYYAVGKDAKKFDAIVKQLEVRRRARRCCRGGALPTRQHCGRRTAHTSAVRAAQGFVGIIQRSGLVVERFFTTTNYRCGSLGKRAPRETTAHRLARLPPLAPPRGAAANAILPPTRRRRRYLPTHLPRRRAAARRSARWSWTCC